jgi:hypothetical protein
MYPQQHRQKCLHALHYNRILGHTFGDTIFSLIKSIHGFTCFNFLLLLHGISCGSKYSIGDPNYQVHILVLFTKRLEHQLYCLPTTQRFSLVLSFRNCWKNKPDHTFTMPHCQNQNLAKRKIQDVKHKPIILLYSSDAPLLFWCYAVKYIIDNQPHCQTVSQLAGSSNFALWQSCGH